MRGFDLMLVLVCSLIVSTVTALNHTAKSEKSWPFKEISCDKKVMVVDKKIQSIGKVPPIHGIGFCVEISDSEYKTIFSGVDASEGRSAFISHALEEDVVCSYLNFTKGFFGLKSSVYLDIEVGKHPAYYAKGTLKEIATEPQQQVRKCLDQTEQSSKMYCNLHYQSIYWFYALILMLVITTVGVVVIWRYNRMIMAHEPINEGAPANLIENSPLIVMEQSPVVLPIVTTRSGRVVHPPVRYTPTC